MQGPIKAIEQSQRRVGQVVRAHRHTKKGVSSWALLVSSHSRQMEKAVASVVEPLSEFALDSYKLVNKCNKPDRRGSCLHSLEHF
jgi:hypothetical protein